MTHLHSFIANIHTCSLRAYTGVYEQGVEAHNLELWQKQCL